MADSLVYKLQNIKEDRNTNLKPENLKAGITCLGVTGTLEQNTGSDVTPIYETTEYTVKDISVDLNETIDSVSTYGDYVVVHTTLNKLKVYDKSNLTEPLMSLDDVSLPNQQFMYIFDKVDNKLYISFGYNGTAEQYYWIANLSTNNISQSIYTNILDDTQNIDLHIDRVNHLVHYGHNNYLAIYSYDVTQGFTELFDTYDLGGSYIGNNVYEDNQNITIINNNGSYSDYNVVPSSMNYAVSGLNYTKTKAFVYSYDDYKTVYVYSLNDDYSLNQLLDTIELSFEFTNDRPIFECLNSNYYYLSYKNNNYILKFDEETNQFSIVLTNENLIVRNSLPYIENENQYIDFEQGNVEIGITYNNKQYLTRDKYSGYTNTTLLSGHTMYDIAHEIVAGTMPNNGDVIITPTTQEQTKEQGYYNSLKVNAVTSDIDENIKAENIKSGVEILGITGTLESGTGVDTSDATATADDIVSPKTAYVNSEKITGTLIKTNFQLSDLQEQGIDISEAVSGNSFVSCNDTDTSICIYAPMNMCLGSNSYFPATMSNSDVADAVGLTADKIAQGNTILGIIGTGGAGTEYEPLSRLSTSVTDVQLLENNFITLSGVVSDTGIVTENETTFVAGTSFENLANTIGLTADKIKKGETILGITGTYEGTIST